MAEVTTVSTGDRALRSGDSLHVSSRDAGDLIRQNRRHSTYSSEGLLAASALDGTGGLLGVLDDQSGTYGSNINKYCLPGVFTMCTLLETVL